jgi:methionine biosynthesis protein MetW
MRIDHDVIFGLVPEGARVLDLGCGDGTLLDRLVREKKVTGRGIEISADGVERCIRKGLAVLHGDIDEGLGEYPEGSFDYVILNQTIQAAKKPEVVLSEMLRVGRKGIVGFPNFAWLPIRLYLLLHGRMPKSSSLPYEWYDTPNIHFCSIRDFDAYCASRSIRVGERVFLRGGTSGRILGGTLPNLFAESAIYLLSRRQG